MIDGGKIGGPPGGGKPVAPQEDKSTQQGLDPKAHRPGDIARDAFERGFTRAGGLPGGQTTAALAKDGGRAVDLIRLAREDPGAAIRLATGLAAQAKGVVAEIERELAAVRVVLEKLAGKRFAKQARQSKSKELARRREMIAKHKLRYHACLRKTRLLEQVAGQLGDTRLEQDINRLLRHHRKLKTDWGRCHHLLSAANSLYGDHADTPEHLRDVIKLEVRTPAQGDHPAEAVEQASPRRALTNLAARALDGTVAKRRPADAAAKQGEFGRGVQACVTLYDLAQEAGEKDPLDKG